MLKAYVFILTATGCISEYLTKVHNSVRNLPKISGKAGPKNFILYSSSIKLFLEIHAEILTLKLCRKLQSCSISEWGMKRSFSALSPYIGGYVIIENTPVVDTIYCNLPKAVNCLSVRSVRPIKYDMSLSPSYIYRTILQLFKLFFWPVFNSA